MNQEISAKIKEAVQYKRKQKFEIADKIYSELNTNYPNDPKILKSWAKTIYCLGDYKKGIEVMTQASVLFKKKNKIGESWQCEDQIQTVKNRESNYDDFLEYMRAVSGNFHFIPKK